MQVMELIHVRLKDACRDDVMKGLADAVQPGGSQLKDAKIRMYRHAALGTDFCVQIFRESQDAAELSNLGLGLASGLSEVGIVHHTIWITTGEWR